jgi:hypothetical protein
MLAALSVLAAFTLLCHFSLTIHGIEFSSLRAQLPGPCWFPPSLALNPRILGISVLLRPSGSSLLRRLVLTPVCVERVNNREAQRLPTAASLMILFFLGCTELSPLNEQSWCLINRTKTQLLFKGLQASIKTLASFQISSTPSPTLQCSSPSLTSTFN